jgi:hypothetical protein
LKVAEAGSGRTTSSEHLEDELVGVGFVISVSEGTEHGLQAPNNLLFFIDLRNEIFGDGYTISLKDRCVSNDRYL